MLVCWKYGLLSNIYSKSHICLMGDTFNNVGGHNLIEPAINKNVISSSGRLPETFVFKNNKIFQRVPFSGSDL